jgi:hypothetical protein
VKKTLALLALPLLVACENDARIVSRNMTQDAENFKIQRRVVFLNGITDAYILTVEGRCNIAADTADRQLEVVCKVDDGEYKKHFLGLSDNVTYFVEQMKPSTASAYHYQVTFKPQTVLPDIDARGSASDLTKNRN